MVSTRRICSCLDILVSQQTESNFRYSFVAVRGSGSCSIQSDSVRSDWNAIVARSASELASTHPLLDACYSPAHRMVARSSSPTGEPSPGLCAGNGTEFDVPGLGNSKIGIVATTEVDSLGWDLREATSSICG